jgi:hypothetical protein
MIYHIIYVLYENYFKIFPLYFACIKPNILYFLYLYIFQACKAQMDGVLFMFSFIDKTSFNDLPHQMSRILDTDDNACKFVMGTKYPYIDYANMLEHYVLL